MKPTVTKQMLDDFLREEKFEIADVRASEDYAQVALYNKRGNLIGLGNLRSFNYHKFGEYIAVHATDGNGPAKVVIEVAIEEPDAFEKVARALREWRPKRKRKRK